MNTPSLYIGLLIVILILLPFIAGTINRRKKENNARHKFIETGFKYGIDISETEIWNDRIIGLDSIGKKLLFRHSQHDTFTETLIDLKNVKSCTIETGHFSSGDYEKVIESIQLVLKMAGTNDYEILCFYLAELDLNLGSEVQIAEKWASKINGLLNK